MASLQDVAAAAGVAVSTASRALGHSSHPVSPALRARIQAIAARLGYEHNPLGAALSTQRLQMIGVIVHDIRDAYLGDVIRGIEDVAHSMGYLVVVCNTDRVASRELSQIELLVSYRAAGLVFASGGSKDIRHNAAVSARLQKLTDYGGHALALAPTQLLIPRILPENRAGARKLAEHILSLDRRRILLLPGPEDSCTTDERFAGFLDAFATAGQDPEAHTLLRCGFHREDARAAVGEALARGQSFGAVLAASDVLAIGALQALQAAGLRVPDDVVVGGFGDTEEAAMVSPALTSVRVPTYELGRRGGEAILALIRGRSMPARRQGLPAELVVRQSTAGSAAPHSLEPAVLPAAGRRAAMERA